MWSGRVEADSGVADRIAAPNGSGDIPLARAATEPVSRQWGFDRGLPVDRYYIESFLAAHRADIRGRVLEVGDATYTRRFGGPDVSCDILHVTPDNERASYTGDLSAAEHIPDDTFDCVILTQTLQLIHDVPAALRTAHRILRPGGVLLATLPGITRTSSVEWADSWHWRFTCASARRLFEEAFARDLLSVRSYGNVAAACAFLYGLATHELSSEQLDVQDPDYDVIVTVRAQKRAPGDSRLPMASRSERNGATVTTQHSAALVLLYHRVAETGLDPWQLSVTPETFEAQLRVLREHARIVPLRELLIAEPADTSPRVAITFDDGYSDNYETVLPLLQRYDAPATVFVCTGPAATGAEFWWDTLERVLLWPNELPGTLELQDGSVRLRWELGNDASYVPAAAERDAQWHVDDRPPTHRHEVFLELWRRLSALHAPRRDHLLDQLCRWAGAAADVAPRHRAMSRASLQRLAASALIDIGAHSVSHPALAGLSLAEQSAEIAASAAWIHGVLGRRPTAFSYPFGRTSDYNVETAQLVRASGFTIACCNVEGGVAPGSDPLQLPRLAVADWDAEQFERTLVCWRGRFA